MSKSQGEAFRKRWNAIKANIQKERDALRDLKEEMDAVEDCAERAVDAIDEAGDALSEYL